MTEASTAQAAPVLKHNFKAGDKIRVENGRTEMLYHGKVTAVDGSKVTVALKGADPRNRPFTFDTAQDHVNVEGDAIYTAW